jgi:hypothetical protein
VWNSIRLLLCWKQLPRCLQAAAVARDLATPDGHTAVPSGIKWLLSRLIAPVVFSRSRQTNLCKAHCTGTRALQRPSLSSG